MITVTTEPSVVPHCPSFHLFTPCPLVSHPHRSLCCFCQQPWINCTLQLSFFCILPPSLSPAFWCFLMSSCRNTESLVSNLSRSAWKDLCVSSKALLQCCNNGCNGHREPELCLLCLLMHHHQAGRQMRDGQANLKGILWVFGRLTAHFTSWWMW